MYIDDGGGFGDFGDSGIEPDAQDQVVAGLANLGDVVGYDDGAWQDATGDVPDVYDPPHVGMDHGGDGPWAPDVGGVDTVGDHADHAGHADYPAWIRVQTPGGELDAGPATVDSDGDGRFDTAIVHTEDGSTLLVTDADGDGTADVVTRFGADGETQTVSGSSDDGWGGVSDEVSGVSARPGPDAAADRVWARSAWDELVRSAGDGVGATAGVVRIDATTGQWISSN